jgi:hypothetical protein
VAEAHAQPRPVVIHYHIFKNAGTSLDRTLEQNFGATWSTFEADTGDQRLDTSVVAEHLVHHPWIAALSSHTASLPTPVVPGLTIISIAFVRHPIDRARSVYEFERSMTDVKLESVGRARRMSLPGYLEWRLDLAASGRDPTIANFQSLVLSRAGDGQDIGARAISALDRLSFVGLVEEYEGSLTLLQAVLAQHFPRIRLSSHRLNATGPDDPLPTRLARLQEAIGEAVYERLVAANELDLALWERVRALITERSSGPSRLDTA